MSEQDSKTLDWPTERQDDWGTRKQDLDPPYYEGPHSPDDQQPLERPFYESDPPPPPPPPPLEERE